MSQNNIKKIFNENLKYKAKLGVKYPDLAESFAALKAGVMRAGRITAKEKELIAVGIAAGLRCVPCIHAHVRTALSVGATPEEIMDAATVAILMAGAPGMAHIIEVMKAIEAFTQQ
jgi:AhpD family alkylhydroperoxidase